jgi:ATP-dependent Zn protease
MIVGKRDFHVTIKFRYILILVAIIALVWSFWPSSGAPSEPLSTLQKQVTQGQVVSATMNANDHKLSAEIKGGKTYEVTYPESYEDDLVKQFEAKNVNYKVTREGKSFWLAALAWLPSILIFVVWFFVLRGTRKAERAAGCRAVR